MCCDVMRGERRRENRAAVFQGAQRKLWHVGSKKFPDLRPRNPSKSKPPPSCFPQKHPRQSPRHLPVSAAGCSESCCPVIRCRQTCWELWSLAWSMLEEKNKGETSGLARRRRREPPKAESQCVEHTRGHTGFGPAFCLGYLGVGARTENTVPGQLAKLEK